MSKRQTKRRGAALLLCLLLLMLLACAAWLWQSRPKGNPIDTAIQKEREKVVQVQPTPAPAEREEYRSPIDFAALQAVNPDILAWLDIPGTDISYPILRREGEDNFYLSHGENGEPSSAGALFLQSCNSRDWNDPAMVVYGHQLLSGAYFGNLQQEFETDEGFARLRELHIYLPQQERVYQVFAAVPYSSAHLLQTYHFDISYEYYDFLDRICQVRSFSAHVDESLLPEPDEQLLILSTCLRGDSTQRYLVVGATQKEPGL